MSFKMRNNPEASAVLSSSLAQWLEDHGRKVLPSCASCLHMRQEGAAFCTLYNSTPPASVIVTGCNKYEDREVIPF